MISSLTHILFGRVSFKFQILLIFLDFAIHCILVREHTLYDRNILKFIGTYFRAKDMLYLGENTMCI